MLGVDFFPKGWSDSREGLGPSRSRFGEISRACRRRPSVGLGACTFITLLLVAGLASARTEPTVEELKSRVSSASVGDKVRLCVEIAEKQLSAADKLYAADDMEKAQASLTDVVAYSELARDYSIQSHKRQKQTEISVRSMTRKLNNLLHVVDREDQASLKDAITRLERVRDDLLAAMFPKGAK